MRKSRLTIILAVLLASVLLIGVPVGNCKIPKDTPGSELCKADLDDAGCDRSEKLLRASGRELTVLEGTAFGTASGVKIGTFIIMLRCADSAGSVFVVFISYLNDKLKGIEVRPTTERRLAT